MCVHLCTARSSLEGLATAAAAAVTTLTSRHHQHRRRPVCRSLLLAAPRALRGLLGGLEKGFHAPGKGEGEGRSTRLQQQQPACPHPCQQPAAAGHTPPLSLLGPAPSPSTLPLLPCLSIHSCPPLDVASTLILSLPISFFSFPSTLFFFLTIPRTRWCRVWQAHHNPLSGDYKSGGIFLAEAGPCPALLCGALEPR